MLAELTKGYPNLKKEDVHELVWNKVVDHPTWKEVSATAEKSRLKPISIQSLVRVAAAISSGLRSLRSHIPRRMAVPASWVLDLCTLGWNMAGALLVFPPLAWLVWVLTVELASMAGIELPGAAHALILDTMWLGVQFATVSASVESVVIGLALGCSQRSPTSGLLAIPCLILLRAFALLWPCIVPLIYLLNMILFVVRLPLLALKGEDVSEELFERMRLALIAWNVLPMLFVILYGFLHLGKINTGQFWLILFGTLAFLPVLAVVGGLVKVLSDIFLYTCDEDYRDKILAYLDSRFEEVFANYGNPSTPIIIAAHSLGTVIALDYLWNVSETIGRRQVILITGGSPIARFFFRFFPGKFFPASSTACVAGLAARFSAFSWHNFYRPHDYVGSKLGLPKTRGCTERIVWRIFPIHTSYFSDAKVADLIDQCLSGDIVDSTAFGKTPESNLATAPVFRSRAKTTALPHFPELRKYLSSLFGVFLILAFAAWPFVVSWAYRSQMKLEKEILSYAAAPASTVYLAEVSKFIEMQTSPTPDGNIEIPTAVFEFRFLAQGDLLIRRGHAFRIEAKRESGVLCSTAALDKFAASQSYEGDIWKLRDIRVTGPYGTFGDYLAIDYPPEPRSWFKRWSEAIIGGTTAYLMILVVIATGLAGVILGVGFLVLINVGLEALRCVPAFNQNGKLSQKNH